jgi:hypothetical protein
MQSTSWPEVQIVDEARPARCDDAAIWLRRSRWLHGALLVSSALVMLAAAILSVRGEKQVVLPVLGLPLPELCYWRTTLGMDCPGCGLTRCFISMAHLNVARAWHFSPVGILLFGAVAFQVPYRLVQLRRINRFQRELEVPGLPYIMLAICVLLIVQWLCRTFW